jgi:tRNA dimethylallyltransferase
MVNTGLEVEAKTLSSMKSLKPLNTVGYREWFNDNNQKNKKFVIEEIKKNSRRYAKRQITWFKKYKSAIWIEPKKSINYIIQNHK